MPPLQSNNPDADIKSSALRVLAADIRCLRKAHGLTLARLAARLGRSVGWLSQVERGISLPSLADLRALSHQFKVPVSFFFRPQAGDENESRIVVRAGKGRRLASDQSGVTEELLSPDLGGRFEILRCEFAPGSGLAQKHQRAAEEAGHIISGKLEIEIAGQWYQLEAGDSFCVRGEPLRWCNPGNQKTVVLWVISPPNC
ncbi:cupin domain-containing protein [Chelativorans sp. Marseille-P2723]|uniref:cupin domain-containing protein n=1 Tax=Chelativorans sp. Marseille-P2723 TaxID=2709133 RepID=UPI001571036E|nr:cupin domain-containing protein [Chelativorans sp. Marseille-P2723]